MIIHQQKIYDALTLPEDLGTTGIAVFNAAPGEKATAYITYVGGDETTGMAIQVKHVDPIDGGKFDQAEQADALVAEANRTIAKSGTTKLKWDIPGEIAGNLEFDIEFTGTSAAAPGNVTMVVVATGIRQ